MDGVAVSVAPSSTFRLGKMFVSPAFDYLLIGGLLSWVAGGILYWGGFNFPDNDPFLWWAILVSNWAHFAASTVRLYTKPGAVKTWPFLTLGFPVIAVAVVTAALVVGEPVGRYLFALYLVWSPYHYSRQAYGLSVMYAYRSGSALETADKRWILWACLIPFFWTLIHPDGGMALLLPRGFYTGFPMRTALMQTLTVLSLVAPVALFLWLRTRRGLVLPMISVAVIVSNAIWWTLFNYFNAFVWATVFHGLQYLAIVSVFHIRDQERRASNVHGWFFHTATFYVTCLILGWVLFFRWPQTYWLFGFGIVQSGLLVTAIINIHHFVVDAFIWRLKRDPNYQTVVDTAPVPAPVS
jgi:hypothetical protein